MSTPSTNAAHERYLNDRRVKAEAADLIEAVSIALRSALADIRAGEINRHEAYNAVYLLRRDLSRAVAMLDAGYKIPRSHLYEDRD